MATISNIDIQMRTDTAPLERGMTSARSKVKAFTGEIGGLSGSLGSLGGSLAGIGAAVGGLAIVGALKGVTAGTVELIDSTTDAAARLGVTVQELTELRFAAKYLGTETSAVDAALTKFSVNLGNLDEDGGKAGAALKRLGIESADLDNLSPAEALKEVADGFAQLPDQSSRAAVAMAVFGKSGTSIIPFLSAGRAGIDKLIAEGNSLGVTFDDLSGQKIGDLKDSWDKMVDTLQGGANRLLVEVSPALTLVGNAATTAAWAIARAGHAAVVGGKALVGIVPDAGGAPVNAGGDAAAKAADAELAMQAKVDDLNKKLQQQIDTFGQTTEGVKLFELQTDGATAAQLKQTRALLDQKKALDETKKANDELKSSMKSYLDSTLGPLAIYNKLKAQALDARGAGLINGKELGQILQHAETERDKPGRDLIAAQDGPAGKYARARADLQKQLDAGDIGRRAFDAGIKGITKDFKDGIKAITGDVASPLESYRERMKALQDGLDKGSIDKETYRRAHENALADYRDATKSQFAAPVEAGTQAFRSEMMRFTTGSKHDPWSDLSENQRKQVAATDRQTAVLTSIDRKLTDKGNNPDYLDL